MSTISRRKFIESTAAVAGGAFSAFTIAGTRASGRVIGANDTIHVGVVGLRSRGAYHVQMVSGIEGARVTGLCDADPAILAREVEKAEGREEKVRAFSDVRRLLDCKDVDAVSVATPNHWHSLIGVWACQAGKDAHIEKPISHNVWEGRQLARAARKYQRMVQTGTQARSNPDLIDAVRWVRAGNLGKIKYVVGLCYNPRPSIGKVGKGQIPPGLDYDLWIGPAPMKPLGRKNLHYDWHWIYDYGNGDLGNQGIHEMDIGRWFLGYQTLSSRVMSIGGRLGYDDDGQTPNTQVVYHDYDGPPLIFEVRGLPESKEFHDPATRKAWRAHRSMAGGKIGDVTGIGVVIVCEGGRVIVQDGGLSILALDSSGKTIKRLDREDERFSGWRKGDHYNFRSWMKAIRSRKTADLTAEIFEGHISSALCHTGMISHRLGQTAANGTVLEQIKGDSLAVDRFEAFNDHLERNGIDLSKPQVTLGPWLNMEPKAERFIDNDAANALLSRDYRQPFVVPD